MKNQVQGPMKSAKKSETILQPCSNSLDQQSKDSLTENKKTNLDLALIKFKNHLQRRKKIWLSWKSLKNKTGIHTYLQLSTTLDLEATKPKFQWSGQALPPNNSTKDSARAKQGFAIKDLKCLNRKKKLTFKQPSITHRSRKRGIKSLK